MSDESSQRIAQDNRAYAGGFLYMLMLACAVVISGIGIAVVVSHL